MSQCLPSFGSKLHIAIVGASRGIGFAFVQQFLEADNVDIVYAMSRDAENSQSLQQLKQRYQAKLCLYQLDITDVQTISKVAQQIKTSTDHLHCFINCAGILHDESGLKPEKRLDDICQDNIIKSFTVNTFGMLLLAKHFYPFFDHNKRAVLACISARVSSLDDNRTGGWYSYRSSKAALNMIMKNISLEFKRIAKTTICLSLHPGTVATDLSAPFTKNICLEKLFSPEKSVSLLLHVIDHAQAKDSGNLIAWDGSRIPW